MLVRNYVANSHSFTHIYCVWCVKHTRNIATIITFKAIAITDNFSYVHCNVHIDIFFAIHLTFLAVAVAVAVFQPLATCYLPQFSHFSCRCPSCQIRSFESISQRFIKANYEWTIKTKDEESQDRNKNCPVNKLHFNLIVRNIFSLWSIKKNNRVYSLLRWCEKRSDRNALYLFDLLLFTYRVSTSPFLQTVSHSQMLL